MLPLPSTGNLGHGNAEKIRSIIKDNRNCSLHAFIQLIQLFTASYYKYRLISVIYFDLVLLFIKIMKLHH